MAAVLVIVVMWPRICGNYPIEMYGRIADEHGNGIADVRVEYRIYYSDSPAIPMLFGREERQKNISTTTNRNGDYQLEHVYGYAIELKGVTRNNKPLKGTPNCLAPGWSWSLEDRFQRAQLPSSPDRRVTYAFETPIP